MANERGSWIWTAAVISLCALAAGSCADSGDESRNAPPQTQDSEAGNASTAGGHAGGAGAPAAGRDAGARPDASSAGAAGSTRSAGSAGAAAGKATADASVRDAGPTADASTPDASMRDPSVPGDAGPAPIDAATSDGGAGTIGPSGCLPAFKQACSPEIVFKNDEPSGRGAIFMQVIPDPVATMQDAVCTVCSILFRTPDEIPMRSRHKAINLTLRDNENLADASGNTIRIDLKHIAGYSDPKKALVEFRGVLVHEGAHLYQNYGNGGLGEGMADFVRIRAGLYEPGRRRTGGAWTDPYTTSGFFFSWLAGPGVYHKDGREPHDVEIGYLINKTIGEKGPTGVPPLLMMRFGASVDALWREYQAAIMRR